MKLVEFLFVIAILLGVFIVARADITNPSLLQSLVDAAVWLSDNISNYNRATLEAIMLPFKWLWQLVLDNADQIGQVWASEVMPGAEDAEAAAEQMAAFIRDELGPILEALG